MATTYGAPGVFVEEVERGPRSIQGVGTAVAAFVGLTARTPGDDPDDPSGLRPRLVTNWSQFERLYGSFTPGAVLPHAVHAFFGNGGGRAYIVPVAAEGDGEGRTRLGRVEVPAADDPDRVVLAIEALQAGPDLEVLVQPDAAAPAGTGDEADEADEAEGAGGAPTTFTISVRRDGRELESFPGLSTGPGGGNVAQVIGARSTTIRVEQLGDEPAPGLPAAGTFVLEPPASVPASLPASAFEGTEADRRGIRGLVIAEDVTMVAVPDLVTAATSGGTLDLERWRGVQRAVIDHCELAGNRMAILDAPPGMSPQQVAEWRSDQAMYDSRFATLYYPWLKVRNPFATGPHDQLVDLPPSGAVAGIWARSDGARGVHKAPANEVVRGALDVSTKVTDGEQALLNPIGINCIRAFGVRGIRVWGARTLSSDSTWRYLNVRRLFNYVEESLRQSTGWVVFEPNDRNLWQRVRQTVNGFLYGLWLDGALVGATPDQAYVVKCDEENNPPSQVDEGLLVVDIGLAPVRPAEFVVFRLAQSSHDAAPGS